MIPATESVQSMFESNGDRPLGSPTKNISSIPGGGELERAQKRIKELEQTVRVSMFRRGTPLLPTWLRPSLSLGSLFGPRLAHV
jgi:hypothetical protein